MKAWLRDILDAFLLRSAAFARVAERPDAFLRGLLVILAVALIAGLPQLVGDVIRGFQPPAVLEPTEFRDDLTRSLADMRPWLQASGLPEEMVDRILTQVGDNVLLGGSIAVQVQQADTTFPRPLAEGLRAIGEWLSLPFASSGFPLAAATLATWLGYGIWVMLAAKLLGGTGTLHGFFGATAFFAVPHVLKILSPIPVLGGIVSVVALVWGLVIYIVATAVSHRLTAGRALLAVFLPILVLLALVALILIPISLLALVFGGNG